jgi:hypothetical protein
MRWILLIFLFLTTIVKGQNFSQTGRVFGINNLGVPNIRIQLWKRTTSALTGFTSQTNYNGHSYYRSTTTNTWLGSKSVCESMGGHLVTISNAAENTFVFNTWPSGWIGYYQDKTSGFFFTEPLGGWRWTELPVTRNLVSNYDISDTASYQTTAPTVVRNTIRRTNATLFNNPTYTATSGRFLSFNGSNQYMMTENLASFFTTNAVSLMLWVFPTDAGVLISEQGSPTLDLNWFSSQMEITNVSGSTGTLRVGTWSSTGLRNISTPITLNRWHFICLTHSGTELKGYLNGTNFGSLVYNRMSPYFNSAQLYYTFASRCSTNMGDGTNANARLGSFQVSNVVWSDDEINRSYMHNAYRFGIYPYSNWNSGEPNNSNTEDYAQFVTNGRWNDLPNSVFLNYVLEFDYIMTNGNWTLDTTILTNNSGDYSFLRPTNPSVEWRIILDTLSIPAPQRSNLLDNNNLIFSRRSIVSADYFRYDLNTDNNFSVSDIYLQIKKSRGHTWSMPNYRIYTQTEHSIIRSSTTNLRLTYPGIQTTTTTSLTSGGVTNFYIIRTGYDN